MWLINQHNSLQLSQNSPNIVRRATRMIRHKRQKGRHAVSASIRFFRFSRVVRAVAALWLLGSGAAWAGSGGGEDAPVVQQVLDIICSEVGMPAKSCPQLPTAAQIAAEISGLVNGQIDDVRNVLLTGLSDTPCGNLFFV